MNNLNFYSRSSVTISLLAVLLITFFSFMPSLNNSMTNWDDNEYITDNPYVITLNGDNIRSIFTTTVSEIYSPLTVLSFAIEYHFFKDNPFIYHFNNLILHVMITALIFFLALKLGLSLWGAGGAALLFGIHPMHVESVAWIAERKDVLYVFFYMLALNYYWGYLNPSFAFQANEMQNLPPVPTKGREVNPATNNIFYVIAEFGVEKWISNLSSGETGSMIGYRRS